MLVLLSAFLSGVVFVLALEVFVLYRWFRAQPEQTPQLVPKQMPVTNPKVIADFCGSEEATESESCMFLNLILQFLWREWRDSPRTRNFFIRKMNMELKEMLLKKNAGKLMEQITVRDYFLGDSLPVLKNATVMKLDTRSASQVPREIDIAVDLEYSGGFVLSLDVDLIFGKSAHFTVKLESLYGRMRLQLTRNPCTHWSFSFYDEPIMDLKVESNFEGKNLPKLTSFISNQIRKSIKKKHTLPNYKVRYKPFFVQQTPEDGKNEVFVHNSLITVGTLDVEIVECTRLPPLPKGWHIYCALSLDSLPWKEDMPMGRSLWPVHEVLICRATSGNIGVSFFQEFEDIDDEKRECVLIKTIHPNSPASQVDIQRGDFLISVNNVDIVTLKQAVRLIKNAGNKFTFKLQRPPAKESTLEDHINKSVLDLNNKPSNELNVPNGAGLEDSFGYKSILLHEDDSETEEFVNIVVNEIQRELNNIQQDEATRKFIREVESLRRPSEIPKVDQVDNSLEQSCSKSSDSSSNRSTTTMQNGNIEPPNGSFTLPIQINHELEISTDSCFSDSGFSKKKKRSFTFNFNRKNKKLDTLKESDSKSEILSASYDSGLKTRTFSHPLDVPKAVDTVDYERSDSGWDNISKQHVEIRLNDKPVVEPPDEKEPNGQKTTVVAAHQEPVWNEIFTFDTEKEHKFLNICVWGKCDESFDKDVLLGYVSIPVMELALECLSTSSRKAIQTFSLASSSRSNISRSYIRMMPGLNPSQCNGDITLAYKYATSVPEDQLHAEEEKIKEETDKRMREHVDKIEENDVTDEAPKEHNFIGTEFYFPTRCEYCQRKVWRKVAFQCRVCTMVCHKRCLQNAQQNTYCTKSGVRAKPPVWQKNLLSPTSPPSGGATYPDGFPRSTSVPAHLGEPKWKMPKDIDLRPGHKSSSENNMLRRRKHVQKPNIEDIIKQTDNISHTGTDSITIAAVAAKEAGREFFATLEEENKETKLQKKLQKLQEEISLEDEEQGRLQELLAGCADESKQGILTLQRKSEERVQALSLLMIQFYAALNECLTTSQPQQCDL